MRKNIIKFMVVLLGIIFGGCFGNDEEKVDITYITLSANRIKISADNIDSVEFKAVAYDYNGKEKSTELKLYMDNIEQTSMNFKTEKSGIYKFTAKSGNIISNELIINAVSKTGEYYLISNESIDSLNKESIEKILSEIKINFNLPCKRNINKYEKIKINPYLKFEIPLIKDYINQFRKKIKYSLGEKREFFTYNFKNKNMEKIGATLQFSGKYCEIWANNTVLINKNEAEKMAVEFDEKIYKLVTENFAEPSDIDGNGKVEILCYDIKDDFDVTGVYAGGYFYEMDLSDWYYSNKMEIFYIDTYPAMYDKKNNFDISLCYETLVHEFQHMVNFNKIYFIDGKDSGIQPAWLNEGLSQAAEQLYKGTVLDYRINTYSSDKNGLIREGYSLLDWNNNIEDYSLSYLFLQYIKVQSKQGNAIFKEIFEDENHNYKSIEKIAQKYIKADITFGELMTAFRTALLKMDNTGLYGYQGAEGFGAVNAPIYYGGEVKNLYGGGAIVIPAEGILIETLNYGENIKYIKITK